MKKKNIKQRTQTKNKKQNKNAHAHAHTYIHTYTHIHTYTYTHTYIHAYIRTHRHTPNIGLSPGVWSGTNSMLIIGYWKIHGSIAMQHRTAGITCTASQIIWKFTSQVQLPSGLLMGQHVCKFVG